MERPAPLRPHSAPAPPRSAPGPPRSPERRAQPLTSRSRASVDPCSGLSASPTARRVPETLLWMGALRPQSWRQGLPVLTNALTPCVPIFQIWGYEGMMPTKRYWDPLL